MVSCLEMPSSVRKSELLQMESLRRQAMFATDKRRRTAGGGLQKGTGRRRFLDFKGCVNSWAKKPLGHCGTTAGNSCTGQMCARRCFNLIVIVPPHHTYTSCTRMPETGLRRRFYSLRHTHHAIWRMYPSKGTVRSGTLFPTFCTAAYCTVLEHCGVKYP